MFRRSQHRYLVRNGAPTLPNGYFYLPVVIFEGNTPLLRMEIRKSRFIGSTEVARWTVDPSTYFNDKDSAFVLRDKVNKLCENVARRCNDFEVVERD